MKTVCLTLAASASATQQLFNLPNAEVLAKDQHLTPFESVAHLETFDTIPVFGGQELRSKMLQKAQNSLQEKGSIFENIASNSFGLAKNISRGFNTVSQTVGQSISHFAGAGLATAISSDAASLKLDLHPNGNVLQSASPALEASSDAKTASASLAIAAIASALYLQ